MALPGNLGISSPVPEIAVPTLPGSIPSPAQSWTQAPGDQKNEESATSADSVPQ
eukprot:CAMPEP_0184288856 /NCGR_PEP_ID=MMETSP1049-20130417/1351_1 /TAXON_ID=77928 /ORGANISM="Proteomonas sulcata, Strain CCMP704" /LENGTH=53 /DNA_ID=CAMNT_0026595439 /DNA_START=418 /DNA_END=579 /DNA_ORIENTATION=+